LQTLQTSFASVPRAIDTFLYRQEQAAERIRTGQRINRPADDPAAFNLALSLRSEVRIKKQAMRNILEGLTYLDALESALRDWSGRLARLRKIAPRTTSPGREGAALQREFDALSGEVHRLLTRAGHPAPGDGRPNTGPVLVVGGDSSPANRFDLGRELTLEPLDPSSLAIPSVSPGEAGNGADASGPLDKALQTVSRNLGRVAAARSRLARIESHLAQSALNLRR